MGIKFTGLSTPFGGISWEYTEKKREDEYEAIQLLLVILESKRLITLPYSRNYNISTYNDRIWCSASAMDLKDKILLILSKYRLTQEVINELQGMIHNCNSFLESISSLDMDSFIINDDAYAREKFLKLVDKFKKSLSYHIKILSKKYSIEINEIGGDLYRLVNEQEIVEK